MTQPQPPRRFYLQRDVDITGVSGTGRVADGVLWPDGTASVRWTGERPSTVHWDRMDDAESTRNAKAIEDEETRTSLRGIAAGWRSAEFLLRHTLTDLDNRRTTPDNPPASDDRRRRALARNAVGPALNAHGQWLPLTVREAIADAVLAALDGADDAPATEANDRQPGPPEPASEDAAAHRILTTICETNRYRPPPPGIQITAADLAEIDRMVEHGTPFGEAVRDVIGLAAWRTQQADAVLDQRINDALNGPTETPS